VEDLVITESLVIPAGELRVAFARSGGPGGQNVNKVETKVELRWNPAHSAALGGVDRGWLLERVASKLTSDGDLLITSSRTRDQSKNREDARAKLAETLRQALRRPKRRRKTRPSAAAVEARLQSKQRRSRVKRQRRESPRDPAD
jgi:ribosome-associated protein